MRRVVVLPGAVRAEEAVDLAAADAEIDAADRDDRGAAPPPAVAFDEAPRLDDEFGRSPQITLRIAPGRLLEHGEAGAVLLLVDLAGGEALGQSGPAGAAGLGAALLVADNGCVATSRSG